MNALRTGIWWSGNTAWLFGLCDRTYAAISDRVVTAIDLVLLFTAALLFVAWLFLKPTRIYHD